MHPKGAEGSAKSVDPDLGLHCFAQAYLSENLSEISRL